MKITVNGEDINITNEQLQLHLINKTKVEIQDAVNLGVGSLEEYLGSGYGSIIEQLSQLRDQPKLYTRYQQIIWVNDNRIKNDQIRRVKNKVIELTKLITEEFS